MMLPKGKYKFIPRIEVLCREIDKGVFVYDVLEINGPFYITHSRPGRDIALGDYGAVLDILVKDGTIVKRIRNGEEKEYG
jgi:hypothetical protein